MWSTEESPFGRIVIAPSLPDGVAVFYTTRDFEGRITDDIARQITGFIAARFRITSTLATCRQIHSATVVRAPNGQPWRECDSCDALWTDERNTTLGIKVADCLPIAMVDPQHSVTANIHSGWRGAAQRITDASLEELERATAFDAASAMAWLGPSIRACCFEVGEEVVSEFQKSYGDVDRYVDRSRSKPHIDLVAITKDVLLRRGFADERIFDSGLCTRCDGSLFHSYRREGPGGGRNLAFVAQ